MEQTTKPITLEDAAISYAITPKSPQGSIPYIHKICAFEAGAQWQKEQDKELASKLHGMQSWITDKEMKDLFTEIVFKLTS